MSQKDRKNKNAKKESVDKKEPSITEVAVFYNSSKEAKKIFKLNLLNLILAPVIFGFLGISLLSILAYLIIASHLMFKSLKLFYKIYNTKNTEVNKELFKKAEEILSGLFVKKD